jgi:hypothetical protein
MEDQGIGRGRRRVCVVIFVWSAVLEGIISANLLHPDQIPLISPKGGFMVIMFVDYDGTV